ncbi:monocarboxylate transporter 12-B-like isoform X3 [Haliotis rufescens]|uniref:monocarboxylate transporter 12-B-like isoform X3 n=1 Tax=Haliotis rufescens TaxID=6454 RepID=UPI00201EBA4A|nr:monocarboxylate transporter 12-B-like isoform X3 [Haliotis rufescens]
MTSTSTEPIELQPDLMVVEPERDDSGALRAPDGGWGWVCVAGRFFVVALVLGLVSGFGIVYVEIIDHFDTTRVETAWMSSLHSATYCITGLVGGGVLERFGCRAMTVAASILTSAGFIFSLFAQNLVLLCVLYGVLTGAGVSLMYTASTVIVLQYFDKKRGLAMSISSLGEGVGMLVLPPLTYLLIETYSWRGAFLVTAGITLNAAVFGLLFKPPPYLSKAVQNNTQRRKKDMLQSFKHLLHKKLFFLFALGSFLVHAGYTVPLINLIDLVDLKDIDKSQSAMLIPAMGVSTIFSLVLFGWVSDFPGVNRTGLHAGSIAVMAVSVMLVPALDSIEAFFVFAAVYGVFMGTWHMGQAVIVTEIVGVELTGVAFGIHTLHAGVGMFVSSLLAGWLFDITGNYVWSFYVSGGLYLLGCFVTLLVLIARHLATRNKHRRDNAPSAEVRPLSQS